MIGLLGLDHHWANAELRGRLSFSGDRLSEALQFLRRDPVLAGVVLLATCNRTEVYLSTSDWDAARTLVMRFLAQVYAHDDTHAPVATTVTALSSAVGPGVTQTSPKQTPAPLTLPDELAQVLYFYEGSAVAQHLFRVSAGLQSMVLGEAQILGQVKDALTAAESVHATDEELRSLFTHAIKAGKRVRSDTEIGRADVSVAGLAVHVAREALGTLAGKNALIVGAGKTSQLCAKLLREEHVGRLFLANRTASTASELAAQVDGEVLALDEIARVLPQVHVLLSATAAPHSVLSTEQIAEGTQGRTEPLVMLDLAVPADIEASAAALPFVTLHTLDTLRNIDATVGVAFGDSGEQREAELVRAEQLVEEAIKDFVRAQTMRLAVPGISALRRHVDESQKAELARALGQLDGLSEAERAVVARFGSRLVDKMFHHLVSRVRALAEYDEVPPEVTMRILAQLFADPDTPPSHA